ncbi:MAG TPA: glycosyltransferase family 4 protein [Candidatus Bathyarchaeia archaeon]|jgi:phosphatidyl-myo-inositol dimannoside synthase|nr:glycosyltransferase family 4 protein [Candidatus Bathyarchaeia archaeon]
MGILIISWNFPPRRGGIEYVVSHLFGGLRERHPVLVITGRAPFPRPAEEDVFRAPYSGLIFFSLYTLWRGARLLLRSPKTKVIFGGSVMVTPLVLILARLFGRKAVVQAHGLDVIYANKFYQAICVRWLRFCDRIVANSGYTAFLVAQKRVRQEIISVIPPGVQTESFTEPTDVDAIKKGFGLQGKHAILFVGRLAKRKGVKEFIENSFAKIVSKIPNVCFVVVGNNPSESLTHRDDMMGQIKAVICAMGLLNHVQLCGAVDDDEVIKLYQACDVVVLPALAETDDVEGFGIVLLEAAAAGKPAVATRVGGIPDAIEHEKTGVLVNAGDYEGLAQAVLSLLNDPLARSKMGRVARQRAEKEFGWEEIVDRYETAFRVGGTSTNDHNVF